MSVEKLFEKYNSLAKEAMSTGDKTLAENYLQHADHFQRIIEDKNKNRNQNRFNVIERVDEEKNLTNANNVNSETSSESKENNQDKNKVYFNLFRNQFSKKNIHFYSVNFKLFSFVIFQNFTRREL